MIPTLSIIVPVYNVEMYLKRCLDSLVKQTLRNIQIILVDDGSTDASLMILEEFAEKYPNLFKVYTKQNGGLSDARNFGLEFVKSKYLGFIDSDDFIEPAMFETMYKKAIDEDADIVVCDVKVEFENSSKNYIMKGLVEKSDNIQKNAILSPLFAWNKIYRTDFFMSSHFTYPKNLWYEDIPVTIPLFSMTKKISYVPQALIHYWQRWSSIMGSKNSKKLMDIFEIIGLTKEHLKQINQYTEFKLEMEYVTIEQLLLFGAFRFYQSESRQTLMENAFKIIHHDYPKWKNNTYIRFLPFHYQLYLKYLDNNTWKIFSKLIQKRREA